MEDFLAKKNNSDDDEKNKVYWANDMLTLLNHLENRRLENRNKNACKCKVDETNLEFKNVDLASLSFATKLWTPKMLSQMACNMVKKATPCHNSKMHDPCMYYHGDAGMVIEKCGYGSFCKHRTKCRDIHSEEERAFFQKTLEAAINVGCKPDKYRRLYCSFVEEHDRSICWYAHNDEEILCYFCFQTGHCTMKCNKLLNVGKDPCRFGINCRDRGQCFYQHSPDVCNYFNLTQFYRRWKKDPCQRKDKHDMARCHYAHGSEDALCAICGKRGHFSKLCSISTKSCYNLYYRKSVQQIKWSFRYILNFAAAAAVAVFINPLYNPLNIQQPYFALFS